MNGLSDHARVRPGMAHAPLTRLREEMQGLVDLAQIWDQTVKLLALRRD